jgi:2-polyprenyl-3-methyl-5-hydroxy-6-metoxy-1,4-benzoquinol methylase
LAKRGYKVVGADISRVSIEVARRKAKKEKMEIMFLYGDMRTIKVGKFDAVITMFNAVGHLTKAGFEKAMRNIRGNLKDGGIYVFDILNADMDNKLEADLLVNRVRKVDDVLIYKLQICRLNRSTGILTMDEQITTQKGNGRLQAAKPAHWTMQIYKAKWLREMLARNGFKVVGQYALDGSKFSEKKTESILTIAKKR